MKRAISLMLAAAAFAALAFACFAGARYVAGARVEHGFVCGLPLLGIYLLGLLAAVPLSAGALVLGVMDYRTLPRPRPVMRVLELVGVALPLLAGAVIGLFAAARGI